MFRRLLTLSIVYIMVCSMVFCLVGCGNEKNADAETGEEEQVEKPKKEKTKVIDTELYALRKDELWGFVDEHGKVIIDFLYEEISDFVEGYCPVKLNGYWGVINKNNDFIIEPEYKQRIGDFKEGYFTLLDHIPLDNIIVGLLDEKGDFVVEIGQYEECGFPYEGVVAAKKDGYWGIVDLKGKSIVDFIYEEMIGNDVLQRNAEGALSDRNFINGLIGVSVNDAYGIINTKGEFIIELSKELSYASIYENFIEGGKATQTGAQLFTSKGKRLLPDPSYYTIVVKKEFENGSVFVAYDSEDNKYGNFEYAIFEPSGEMIWESGENIEPMNFALKSSDFNDLQGVVNRDTNEIAFINSKAEVIIGWIPVRMSGEEIGVSKSHSYISIQTGTWTDLDYRRKEFNQTGNVIYDDKGKLIVELQGEEGQYHLCNDYWAVNGKTLYSLTTKEYLKFSDYKDYNNIPNNDVAAILDENGAFYGLFVLGELKTKFEYTSIDLGHRSGQKEGFWGSRSIEVVFYNQDYGPKPNHLSTPFITMTKGTSEEKIFVSKKGDIIPYDEMQP